MNARIALYIALILLVLLAAAVILVAALVRRPRREWQVAVRGQTQDMRYVGISSLRAHAVQPRKVTLEEIWATDSVPESAYVGVPKIPGREAVAAALAPAPPEVVRQYHNVLFRVPKPAPPPEDVYNRVDPFYEPEVTTGEISLFNAALPRPDFDDEEWDGVDPGLDESLGLTRAREVLAQASAATSAWLATVAASVNKQIAEWKEQRQAAKAAAAEEAQASEVEQAQADVAEEASALEPEQTEDAAEPADANAPMPPVFDEVEDAVEVDSLEESEDLDEDGPGEGESGEERVEPRVPLEPESLPVDASTPAPPPTADDIDRYEDDLGKWVDGLQGPDSSSTDGPRTRWVHPTPSELDD